MFRKNSEVSAGYLSDFSSFFRSRLRLYCVYNEALAFVGRFKGFYRGIGAEQRQSYRKH